MQIPMACGTCRQPLSDRRLRNGQTIYLHGTPPAVPHPAAPVPRIEFTRLTETCDFCDSTAVAWIYTAPGVQDSQAGAAFDPEWTACEACAALIETRALPQLVARVTGVDDDALAHTLTALYQLVFDRIQTRAPVAA